MAMVINMLVGSIIFPTTYQLLNCKRMEGKMSKNEKFLSIFCRLICWFFKLGSQPDATSVWRDPVHAGPLLALAV